MKLFGKDLDTDLVIVAEIGVNHEGDPQKARDLIRLAAGAGADAVKFQSYTPARYVAASNPERLAQVTARSLDEAAHRMLAREAADCGVAFLSTPVTEDWIPLLSELGAAIKIASGDLDFELVIRGAARTGRPVILSVGLGTIEEIDRAVNWVQQEAGENALPDRLALLHCVSAYPTPIEQANISNIDFLRDRYGLSVGYSNHVIGPDACLAAVARGAQILEIHFTDQKEGRTFRDHSLSMDAEDLATLIPQAKRLRSALGTPGAMRQPCEVDNLMAIRKTIVAARPLVVGTVLSMSDLMFVRPRNGLACHETERVLGQCLKQAVAFGDPILPDHFRPS